MGFSFRFSSDFKVADPKILPLSCQSCFALSDFLVVRSEENKYMLRMCLFSFLTTKKPLTESTSVKGE